MKAKSLKRRNPLVRELRSQKYKMRVVKNKKVGVSPFLKKELIYESDV